MPNGNTIDLRGMEQSVSRKQAADYARHEGFEMMFFGDSREPTEICDAEVLDRCKRSPYFKYTEW